MKAHTYSDGTWPTVCVIGTGFSGILAAVKLKTELGYNDFVILEQRDEVGGVWLVNTYPGSGSDAPSHLYSFSFEPNPDWSHNYASQNEILDYLKNIAKKHKLYENTKFHSEVKEVVWDEGIGRWRISVLNRKTNTLENYSFQLVINGCGALRVPNIPAEFESFKGPKFHSAQWDSSIDLENKVVAVIGSGASAVQIIPKLIPMVKELHSYQRKPSWVMPKDNFKFHRFVQLLFTYIPFLLCLYRWFLFWRMEIFYPALKKGSPMRRIAKWHARRHFRKQIPQERDDLRQKLTPKHPFGCTRTIVSNDYLVSMTHPKVKVHVEQITAVNSNSIQTEQEGLVHIDVLILATGFRVQDYFAPMTIRGKDGFDLLNFWIKERPKGYLGIVTTTTPNQFGLQGPHTGLGHNSVIFMAECQMTYVVGLIREMVRRDARVVELKVSTEEEQLDILEKQMSKMVWGHGRCGGSWYENASGINTTLWPWTCVNYWKRTRKPDFTKFLFYNVAPDVINNNK